MRIQYVIQSQYNGDFWQSEVSSTSKKEALKILNRFKKDHALEEFRIIKQTIKEEVIA